MRWLKTEAILKEVRFSVITLMGSGEITKSMVPTYKKVLTRLNLNDLKSCYISVPFEFQENYDELSLKGVKFFNDAFGIDMKPLGFPSYLELPLSEQKDKFLAELYRSNFIFSGPGSPTYALKRFKELELADVLIDKFEDSSVFLAFSSAALIALGTYSLPVYEIYKVGEAPYWETGTNFLGRLFSTKVVLIPHFNNQEGGTHDTSCCYIGRRRFNNLLSQLDDDVLVIGIDEHSALTIDLKNKVAEVGGKGTVTLIRNGKELKLEKHSSWSLDEMFGFDTVGSDMSSFTRSKTSNITEIDTKTSQSYSNDNQINLEKLINTNQVLLNQDLISFGQSLPNIVDDLLDITNITDEQLVSIRRKLRGLIKAYVDATIGLSKLLDERTEAFVKLLIGIREIMRRQKNFELADLIRSSLNELGFEINDDLGGTTWHFKG